MSDLDDACVRDRQRAPRKTLHDEPHPIMLSAAQEEGCRA
jgi:hypothetical protein